MADQKKWFKVWASILNDDGFNNMKLEDIGRWCRLGALICQQGTNGKLVITPPAEMILFWFRVPDIQALKEALKILPNVTLINGGSTVQDHGANGQFQRSTSTVLNDNGSFTVIMKNWHKYQVDSTAYERVKRSRCKKRGEEKRGESVSFSGTPETPKWM